MTYEYKKPEDRDLRLRDLLKPRVLFSLLHMGALNTVARVLEKKEEKKPESPTEDSLPK